MENNINLQVGDRVTYIDKQGKKCIITVLEDKGELSDNKDNPIKEIIKIERPKYEVIEETKELLTDEEKEFFKIYEKVMDFKITEIEKANNKLYVWDMGTNYEIEIDESVFLNLENEKTYTLKELGLE